MPRPPTLAVAGGLAAVVVAFATGCGAGSGHTDSSQQPAAAGSRTTSAPGRPPHRDRPDDVTRRLMGLPPLPRRAALPGYLLIADRDNNRLLVVSPRKRVVWRFPTPESLGPGQTFVGPDDAFVMPSGRGIVTNEEFADQVAIIRLGRKPRIGFQYGHADTPGASPGYLSHPDDAYLLPNGLISVADIVNCRVVFLDHHHHVVRSIGRAGDCAHDPPSSLSQPNGDTPTPDGGVLVTEIGGWVDRFDRAGRLLWSIRTPSSYPSDAQLLPDGKVLVAGFDPVGHIYVITQHGRVVWTYGPPSGPGALDQPSLALPIGRGLIAATDDYGQRVVVIDRRTKRIAWQYGHQGQPGSAPGYLDKPDGLDLIR